MRRAHNAILTEPYMASRMPKSGAQQWVVVGHGRSPEGKGWGALIDSAACVLRMWNWEWQTAEDYGRRYDFGLIETHDKVLRQFSTHNKKFPARTFIASRLHCTKAVMARIPQNSILIDQERWLENEGRFIKGKGETGVWQLTRGGILACWAIQACPPGSTVVLLGFDVIKRGVALPVNDAFAPAYQESGGFWGIGCYAEGKTKEGNHDYPAERKLIELVAAHRGCVSVVFAEDVWPCSSS